MREVGEGGLREICQTMSVISAEIVINSRLEFPDVTPFMKMPKLFDPSPLSTIYQPAWSTDK